VSGFPATALIWRGVAAVQRSCRICGVTASGAVQVLFAEFVWARLSVARFRLLSMEAAALILARWIIENPAELVAQSRLGFALQNGQIRLFGLVASTFGRGFDFATAAAWHTH
jgi:hypothetical protein